MKNNAKADGQRFIYIAVAVAALGGLLFGFDTGVISGAILFIKQQFSLSTTMEEIVVSAVLIGAVIGAAIGGALTGRFGRRRLIILAGIIFTVSAASTALAQTVTVLIAGRIVVGIAIGIASFISPLYIAEIVRQTPRSTGGSKHACDYHRHRCCLRCRLCAVRHPGMANYVWCGSNTINHLGRCNVALTR